jgi:MFS family permease
MKSLRISNTLNMTKQFLVGLTLFFLPLMLFDMGFSGLEIGIFMSTFTVVALFSSFPIGVINDRLNVKYVVAAGMLLESLLFAGLAYAADFWTLLILFVAGSLGGCMIDTSIRGFTFKSVDVTTRGRKLGTYHSLFTGGFGASIVLGGLLLYSMDFVSVLLITSLAFVFMAAVSAGLLSEARKVRFPLGDYRKVILSRYTLLFFIPLFIFGMHWGAEHTSYSLFLRETFGLGLAESGLYMGIPIVILSFAAFYAGTLVDRKVSHRKFFFGGFLISGVGHILMTFPVLPLSFIFRVIHEVGDGLAGVGYYVSFSKLFKKERVSGESGFGYSVIATGATIGSLIFGPMGYEYGFQWPLIVSGMLSIASVLLLFALRKRMDF